MSEEPLSPIARLGNWLSKSISASRSPKNVVAEEQAAVVNEFSVYALDGTSYNVIEPQNTFSPEVCQTIETSIPPVSACIQKRKIQISQFARPVSKATGLTSEPGFRVKMTVKDAKATAKDIAEMTKWEQFFLECGFCEPPPNDKPRNWSPNFETFLAMFAYDSLTYDFAAVRRWKAESKDANSAEGDYAVACFGMEDSARVRYAKPSDIKIVGGAKIEVPYERVRTTTKKDIKYVKIDNKTWSGMSVDEFTDAEIATFIRNPRSDSDSRGYGSPECQQCVDAINAWSLAFNYNLTRFRKDTLPRGILIINGEVDRTAFSNFKLEWKSIMQGGRNRWGIPILQGLSGDKSAVQWIPFDLSSREMEYHQYLFLCTNIIHSAYKMNPEETGYASNNPFRPPLSDSSPEATLEYSQSTGLSPMLKAIAHFLNYEILWKNVKDRRYTFEFVGLGTENEIEQAGLFEQLMNSGQMTPRMVWAIRDQPIPDEVKDAPFWDIPAPPMQGWEMINQQIQMAQQQADAQNQQQMQMQQAQQAQGGEQPPQQMLGQGQSPPTDAEPQEQSPAPMGAEMESSPQQIQQSISKAVVAVVAKHSRNGKR